MQKELYSSKCLTLAENYHTKSAHAAWDGKKAEAHRFGRLCAEQYLNVLQEEMSPENKISIYWRAVMQHSEVRRSKMALELAQDALKFIDDNESLESERSMFENYIKSNS